MIPNVAYACQTFCAVSGTIARMRLIFETPVDALHPFILTDLGKEYRPLIAAAQKELVQKVDQLSDGQSATWGFFPELNPEISDYPACVALKQLFDLQLLQLPVLQEFELHLAFIRLATSEPKSSFGGLHIDASAGIDHLPPKDRRPEQDGILRVLINLYHEPRQLAYCPDSIPALRERGVSIPDDHYEIIKLPPDVPLKNYLVKPVQSDRLRGIMFESSSVLHAGQTNQKGHFLLSYGGYANKALLRNKLFLS